MTNSLEKKPSISVTNINVKKFIYDLGAVYILFRWLKKNTCK